MARAPKGAAWAPAEYGKYDIGALQALARGEAEEHQQKRALDWIIHEVCKTYDQSFRPDSQRETDFAEGKRYVGLTLVKAVKMDLSKLRGKND